jgi:nitrogen fixation NifU-like protein
MDDLYRDYILEHYRRPHNFGVLEAPSVSVEGHNPLCGDRITLQLGVRDGIVERVAFTGRGCAISQASASLLTDEIKGKPLAVVAAFRAADLLDLLGIEISPARLKCAMLSHDTLRRALDELAAAHPTDGVEATDPVPAAGVVVGGEPKPSPAGAPDPDHPDGAASPSDGPAAEEVRR